MSFLFLNTLFCSLGARHGVLRKMGSQAVHISERLVRWGLRGSHRTKRFYRFAFAEREPKRERDIEKEKNRVSRLD